jgi:DNA processing protein
MPRAWIALNSVKGLGPVRIKQLLGRYGTPERVLEQSASRLADEGLVPMAVARQLGDPGLLDEADRQIAQARACGARILTLAMEEYPPLLREIFAPPPVLFVRGSLSAFAGHAVAVVGTRRPTRYGERAAQFLGRELARHHLTVVSGLALGIDAIAHRACVDSDAATVAVLGSGIDTITPSTNRRLGERIIECGAIVSEFPPGTPAEPYNFPRRNRIISGLSAGVIVVEAGRRSGALITAHYALQQGREVFAVPGSIFAEQGRGTLELIRNGATPVGGVREVVEAIEVVAAPLRAATPSPLTRPAPELLSAGEREVLERITDRPARMDQIAEKSGRLVAELFDILLNLELKGLVRQVAGQQFVRM